jgi:bifunctional pyridoxal-dependent enzyme with beta-cystathionase and maltose regulon repressor activities
LDETSLAIPKDEGPRIMSEHDRKILRQDLQDEQDELWHTDLSAIGEELSLMPDPLFHPVNPVNPGKNSLL